MALSTQSLLSKIEANLQAKGYEKVEDRGGYKQYSTPFIEAIAAAVVAEIQQNAQVLDEGAECSGIWSVQ
ncbi:hypothetical protein [Helicobacter japonicus]|uniref:hypothetical protein n=1 Tax=Helicobacter japonicus TaxID=425400 RepID=UPI0025983073|nr:hypothetical protein [Helicobacter japonicus]